ncbi:Synaptophysin-like protein 2 [Trichoplax sp. H2]|nr:Synaptophysin-like protein 2 [Trichoplax sp. H2]|eukprot:RDD47222.1 Synaptophysin-like protein 2 [Trichoplax sp. H2]
MDVVRNSARNGRVLKEPKGFMRIIQWFVAILAFGTATSFSVMTAVTISCGGSVRNETATLKFSYPFASGSLTYASPACNSSGSSSNRTEFVELGSNISASVQFFVFVGVISFLYTLISLGIYVFKIDPANPPEREPYFKVDFVISVIFVIFWIAGAGAWAAALNELKLEADATKSLAQKAAGPCHLYKCYTRKLSEFGKANASVVFGFLNWFLWSANLWFLYKDTPWFKGQNNNNSSSKYGASPDSQQSTLPSQQPPMNDEY